MSTLTVTNIKATGETASRAVSGVAAVIVKYNMSGVIQGTSMNVSSVTDTSNGRLSPQFTSAFSDANYVFQATCSDTLGGSNKAQIVNQDYGGTVSSSETRAGIVEGDGANTYTDAEFCSVTLFGDLA